MKDNT